MHKRIIVIILLQLILVLPVWAEENIETIVKFAQLSDVHLTFSQQDNSRRLFKDSIRLFEDAVKQINKIPGLNFVIITGDMIDGSSKKALLKFIETADTLKVPWYPVLGNHDVSVGGELNKTNLVKILCEKTKGMSNGKTYYSFKPNNDCMVIVLDGTSDKIVTVHGEIPPDQLAWLKGQIESNRDKAIIIAIHYPIVEPVKHSNHSVLEPSRTELYNLINKYPNVIMFISGHYHTAKLVKDRGIIHVSNPALVEYPNAFRIITVKEDGNVVFDWKETTYKELQGKSKNRSKWASTSYGQEKDRINTLRFEK